MVAQSSIEIRGESDFETAGIMFRLKLDQVKPTFIRSELRDVGRALNSASTALPECVSDCRRISFRDEGNQLVSTCGLAALHGLDVQPLRNLENRLLVRPEFIRKLSHGDVPVRLCGSDRIGFSGHESISCVVRLTAQRSAASRASRTLRI